MLLPLRLLIAAFLSFSVLIEMALASSSSDVAVPEWTILYHGGPFKGRAEFLRLMLEDAGVTYGFESDGLYGPKGSMCMFRGSPGAIDDDTDSKSGPFPTLYPPAIWHRPDGGDEVLVNQVGACMIYLGEKLGYDAKSSAERARANSILLNALDYIGDGRRSFHPVKNNMSYKDQKEEGDKESKEFSQTRMLNYLHHFNKVVDKNPNGPKSPVAGGQSLTYADFALLHVVDATAHQFNSELYEQAWDRANVPQLKSYYEWMKDRPNLRAYWSSDRVKRTFCNQSCVENAVRGASSWRFTSHVLVYDFLERFVLAV
jgi:glutathione S-transferase